MGSFAWRRTVTVALLATLVLLPHTAYGADKPKKEGAAKSKAKTGQPIAVTSSKDNIAPTAAMPESTEIAPLTSSLIPEAVINMANDALALVPAEALAFLQSWENVIATLTSAVLTAVLLYFCLPASGTDDEGDESEATADGKDSATAAPAPAEPRESADTTNNSLTPSIRTTEAEQGMSSSAPATPRPSSMWQRPLRTSMHGGSHTRLPAVKVGDRVVPLVVEPLSPAASVSRGGSRLETPPNGLRSRSRSPSFHSRASLNATRVPMRARGSLKTPSPGVLSRANSRTSIASTTSTTRQGQHLSTVL
eukprot:m.175442 g.175442  ORF g.175442 m.175442 type:complete len:308 (-) comp13993_c0_seq1:35-958(-)